ncbi:MAG: 3'-5' exonuclease [Mariprofundaceae bacterium]|nr:3'-5' exonuclease [Mariprofundaceae bacterium]
MAEIIPPLNKNTLSRMTSGEKRLARRLESLLEDDYLVWYDIPIGKKQRYPDFIILHPSRGILFLEVKDWKIDNLKRISKTDIELLTHQGLVSKTHPLEQVRACAYEAIHMLTQDKRLQQTSGKYQGSLIMPYGWGVVWTNITRQQMANSMPEDALEQVLPDHLMMYQDEMRENVDAEAFQTQLWNMFHYTFGDTLTLPQIDRIRWYLFPEVRIDDGGQITLFAHDDESKTNITQTIPDIIRIMDIQQEQLARSLGEGHRVIHGVAGSGKTLILGYRCLHLAATMHKPILVLCFNITLAAKLRAFISAKGIDGQVQVYHFHDWCAQQLRTYHITTITSDKPTYERHVETVIQAVAEGNIPRAQYGALLIDEGHDFEETWLKLIVQMVDPDSNSLLMLYDDAQAIYNKKKQLNFALSHVGIQAKGRTTILRLNYRNTREILSFAYDFAQQYLNPTQADDDHIPLIRPEAAGKSGEKPEVRLFPSLQEEIGFTCRCLQVWFQKGVPWSDMAVIYNQHWQGERIAQAMRKHHIPCTLLNTSNNKKAYDSNMPQVTLLTIHSSKGLEFPRVILFGIGQLKDQAEQEQEGASLLYVGMTRAQECLLVSASSTNKFTHKLQELTVNP